MTKAFQRKTRASEQVLFSVVADVVGSLKNSATNIWGVKVAVNSSRFGVDEALSIRLRNQSGEAEIGKILVIPLDGSNYLLKVPENHTGGAGMPDLDSSGDTFSLVMDGVLRRLLTLGLIDIPPKEKSRLGFQVPGDGFAS